MANTNRRMDDEARAHHNQERETAHEDRESGGRGWHGDPEGHAAAGRKGGLTVSRNRDHMASIGRKGGEAVSQNRQHMAEIGRKGGQSRGARKEKSGSEENRGRTSRNRAA